MTVCEAARQHDQRCVHGYRGGGQEGGMKLLASMGERWAEGW